MTDEELSISDATLIARLREIQGQAGLFASVAADRLAALVKARREDALELLAALGQAQEAYEAQLKAEARAEQLAATCERLEEALLWCSGSADFTEGGVAREGWLKVCAPLLTGGKDE